MRIGNTLVDPVGRISVGVGSKTFTRSFVFTIMNSGFTLHSSSEKEACLSRYQCGNVIVISLPFQVCIYEVPISLQKREKIHKNTTLSHLSLFPRRRFCSYSKFSFFIHRCKLVWKDEILKANLIHEIDAGKFSSENDYDLCMTSSLMMSCQKKYVMMISCGDLRSVQIWVQLDELVRKSPNTLC